MLDRHESERKHGLTGLEALPKFRRALVAWMDAFTVSPIGRSGCVEVAIDAGRPKWLAVVILWGRHTAYRCWPAYYDRALPARRVAEIVARDLRDAEIELFDRASAEARGEACDGA